ncbi:MAG: HD domain-containing protein [Clostridia bacterium]|nr:HD domain-containing protein [Clostridia bacterium]
MEKKFAHLAAHDDDTDTRGLAERSVELYKHGDEVRAPFVRDSHRILHSNAYRRLKHKTQVFFNIDNDHVCTRMEHVAHVQSVSDTIASCLGLNTDLTRAISMGHDLGHAPFGHEGEHVLSALSEKYLGTPFWHERNSLRFVDHVELLADDKGIFRGLDLTYAVRDGIISHCGERDDKSYKPREEKIDLEKEFLKVGQYEPYTWEGCIVKISDRIAYVGRDIEDALSLGFLDEKKKKMLSDRLGETLTTTSIMRVLIEDICRTSTPEHGIGFSDRGSEMLNAIKDFNYTYIYLDERMDHISKYCELVLSELFDTFDRIYDGGNTIEALLKSHYGYIAPPFAEYLARYCFPDIVPADLLNGRVYDNEKIYGGLGDVRTYRQAIIDYLSGMTDRFSVESFDSLLRY